MLKHSLSFSLLAITSIIYIVQAQYCLNHNGSYVDWWVKLIIPNSVSTGYLYFDADTTDSFFTKFQQQPDQQSSPLSQTLNQVQNLQMQIIAWNDLNPNGSQTSTRAHSKSLLAIDSDQQKGFLFDHSMPGYPGIINATILNKTIPQSQQIYGQHAICISLNRTLILEIMTKSLTMNPYYYLNTLNDPNFINSVIGTQVEAPDYTALFNYNTFDNNSKVKIIFKNGRINGSIFQDGLTSLLGSSLLAQTWGRPQQDVWCGEQFWVGNVISIRHTSEISWKYTQDHSKWVYPFSKNYGCFGDMNRMTSQWKRGGAFYCFYSQKLNKALRLLTQSIDAQCQA